MLKRAFLGGLLLASAVAPARAADFWSDAFGGGHVAMAHAATGKESLSVGRPARGHADFDQRANASPLIAAARRYLGRANFTGVRAPWCAAALGKWLHAAGYHRLASLRARDYVAYGRPSGPRVGSIAVLPHHVGIVVAMTPRGPLLLSGNHSRRVGLGVYAARKILAYRRPV